MKILLVTHGYPPELVGGTENSVQATARGLVRAGHEVVVVSGSLQWEEGFRLSEDRDSDPVSGNAISVRRIHRADLYFEHWQKSHSDRVGHAFSEILEEIRPDVVHIHHWIRLTDDLVSRSAAAGVPAVVTLHDLWTTCLVTSRVRPGDLTFCDATPGPDPCIGCADNYPPRTPWLSRGEQESLMSRRQEALLDELRRARAVLCLSQSQVRDLKSFLGENLRNVNLRTLTLGRDVDLSPAPPLDPPSAHGSLVLGSWGSVDPVKGADLIVQAVRNASATGLPVTLHLAGTEHNQEFRERVKKLAEGLDVHMHGAFDEKGLSSHPVTAVHAMVSATRAHETWGLVLDEALSLRLPMVLPRAGAYPEHVLEGSGALYYEPLDVDDLARQIVKLKDEPTTLESLRESLPSLHDVLPTVQEYVGRLFEVYEEVRESGPPDGTPSPGGARGDRANEEWDVRLSEQSQADLGFETGT